MTRDVATIRSFNRCYTQRIGLLAESYLGVGRPLGASRLLFEIGEHGVRIAELRRRLGLDSGYLSRLLRQLDAEGLIAISVDPADGRQRTVRLTSAGRRAWRQLDRRSDDAARRLVAPLTDRQRTALADALTTATRLLRAATVVFEVVDPRSAAARIALTSYFGELDDRFTTGFDVGLGVREDASDMRPPNGAFVLLRDDQANVGCGGLQPIDDTTAEIKRMWIDPSWRGVGLGRRLLAHLEGIAVQQHRRRIVLDTNEVLLEAIAMYERAGYEPVEPYNDNPYAHRWFAKALS